MSPANESASEALADLLQRRQDALAKADAIEQQAREAAAAVQRASSELEQLERKASRGGLGPLRARNEVMDAEARREMIAAAPTENEVGGDGRVWTVKRLPPFGTRP